MSLSLRYQFPSRATDDSFASYMIAYSSSSLELPQLFHNLFEIPIVDFPARDMTHPVCGLVLNLQSTLAQHVVQNPNRDGSRGKEVRQLVVFAANTSELGSAGGHDVLPAGHIPPPIGSRR